MCIKTKEKEREGNYFSLSKDTVERNIEGIVYVCRLIDEFVLNDDQEYVKITISSFFDGIRLYELANESDLILFNRTDADMIKINDELDECLIYAVTKTEERFYDLKTKVLGRR